MSILGLAAAAVVAAARSYGAVGQWAANVPDTVLAALRVRLDPLTGRFVVPDEPPSGACRRPAR